MGIYKPGRPSRQQPPEDPGEYRIVDKESREIKYIGETNNLRRRKFQHGSSGKFNPENHDFAWKKADGRSTSRTRREREKIKIEDHSPPENRRRGGGGRKAKR